MSESNPTQTTEVSSPAKETTLEKITKFLRRTVITILTLGIIFMVGAIGVRWLTADKELGANVGYQYLDDGSAFYLTVEVLDEGGWESPKFTVNGKYKFTTQTLKGGTSYTVDLLQFTSDSGERFRPDLVVPKTVKIESGWASGEWGF